MTPPSVFRFVLVRRALVPEGALRSTFARAEEPYDTAEGDDAWSVERARSISLAGAEPLRAAIIGSSTTFLAHIDRDRDKWDKRARHTAQTAHRYLVRAAKKVSPFGRFGVLELGELRDAEEVSCSMSGTTTSWVELGGTVARALSRDVAARAAEDPAIPLRWNPSLTWEGSSLRGLVPTDTGTKLIEVAPALASRVDLEATPTAWMAEVAGGDAPAVRRALVSVGLLEWDARAPHASVTSALASVSPELSELRDEGIAFGRAETTGSRFEAIHQAERRLSRWMKPADWRTTDVFAEDRYGAARHGFPRAVIEAYMRDVRALALASVVRQSESVAFGRWLGRVLGSAGEAGLVEVVDAAMKLSEDELPDVHTYAPPAPPEAGSLSREGDHLRVALARDEGAAHELGSIGAWIAVGTEGTGGLVGALSAVGPGYGRGFGRFVRGMPRVLLSELREENARAARGGGLFELPSGRPADAHPHLGLPALSLAGHVADSSAEGDSLFLRDLRVLRTPTGHALHHRTRGPLRSVDLRVTSVVPSRLEWLVHALSGRPSFDVSSWVEAARAAHVAVLPGEVLVAPRVVSGSGLVLARRRWLIPPEAHGTFSMKTDGERRSAYLALAKRLGLPAVHFATLPGLAGRSRSSHKPRYVHLGSLLAVDDLVRTWARDPGGLVVEEAYPTRGITIEGERFATELYVEDRP